MRSAPTTDALLPHGRENLRHLISEGEAFDKRTREIVVAMLRESGEKQLPAASSGDADFMR